MNAKVEKPIFVVGTGRCGSTVFHQIFAEHPHVAWLSVLCDYFPSNPAVNKTLLKAIDYPLVGRLLKNRRALRPWEPYNFWEQNAKGFKTPCRDLTASDVTHKVREKVSQAPVGTLTPKRNRFLAKITGWSRMSFLYEIFPDAKFIHIVRDGRAVANSMLNVNWWWGWRGPENWRWGELSPAQRQEWECHGRSFIALAGIEWKILMNAMEAAKTKINLDNYLELKYETFCEDPIATFEQVADFCELPFPDQFERAIRRYRLRNSNDKWRQDMTADQQRILEEVLCQQLLRYGYKVER